VHAQTYRNYDITVVDDGSKDGSAAVIESIPGVRLIRQENRGEGGARNRGIAESGGELMVFLDADDRLLPDCLRVGVEALATRPDHGFVFGFSQPIGADGQPGPVPEYAPYTGASFASFLAGRGMVPPGVAMFRRVAVQSAGGFRVGMKLAADHEFYLRVAQRYPIYCHNQIVAEYRSHPGNVCKQSTTRLYLGVRRAMALQADFIRGKPELEAAHRQGRRHWARTFGRSMAFELLRLVKSVKLMRAAQTAAILTWYYPRGFWEVTRFHLERLAGRSKG